MIPIPTTIPIIQILNFVIIFALDIKSICLSEECKSLIICAGTHYIMKATSAIIVGLLMLIAGIFLSNILVLEDHRIFAQLGIPADSILLNNTNMTARIAPTMTENTTITPAPEVNETLIGRSTPTTSNTTLLTDNKTGETKPLGGIK
jgi:hypothetical protein